MIDFSKMEGHTPGPWTSDRMLVGNFESRRLICSTRRFNNQPDVTDHECNIENEANARLIAAAPAMKDEILRQRAVIDELVDAAMDLRMFAICKMDDASRAPEMAVFRNFDAAIKKAKGE